MLEKVMKQSKQVGGNILAMYSSEYILLLFLCFFSVIFLVVTFLFLTTGEEMIFLSDIRLPFQSSVLH